MADISKITLPNGSTYYIKDVTARNSINDIKTSISSGIHYIGLTNSDVHDGATTNAIILVRPVIKNDVPSIEVISKTPYTPKTGDLVIKGNKEYIYAISETSTTGVWHEFGSTGSLKALAFKDTASGSVTPSGTVSKPTFTGTAGTVNVTGNGFVDGATIETSVASYGPNGYNLVQLGPGSKEINLNTHISGGSVTTTPTTANINHVTSVGTLPTFSATVTNETLSFKFNAGSLPSTTTKSVVTGVTSKLTNPTVEVSPFSVVVHLSTDTKTLSGTFTPQGTISQPTFTGNASNVTVR